MLVKNKITGEKIDKSTAFVVVKTTSTGNKRNEYYSSEEEYNNYIENIKNKNMCIDLFKNIIGYQEFQKIPTNFYKHITEWQPYGYNVVLQCMQECRSKMEFSLKNVDFNSEYNMVQYLCAIISNNLNDCLKKYKKLTNIKQRDNEIITEDIDKIGKTNVNTKNIKDLLGDI